MILRLNRNTILPGFVFLLVFGAGVVLLEGYFTEYLTAIRAGLVFVILVAAMALTAISTPSYFRQQYIPLFYFAAIIWGYFYQVLLLYDVPLHASFFRCFFYLLLMLGMLLFLLNKKFEARFLYVVLAPFFVCFS